MEEDHQMKSCTSKTKCNGELKPLSEFHRDRNRLDGHKDACKECTLEYKANMNYWRKSDREEYDIFNYNRKKYIESKYPEIKHRSFTSFVSRKCVMKISEMTREDIDQAVAEWLGNKRG